jgi:hypothetical protein
MEVPRLAILELAELRDGRCDAGTERLVASSVVPVIALRAAASAEPTPLPAGADVRSVVDVAASLDELLWAVSRVLDGE